MAVGILLMVVMAVTLAVTAGQHHAFEAQQRIAATIAAEELMGRLSTLEYQDLAGWHGYEETPGNMTAMDGDPMPAGFRQVGRRASVQQQMETLPGSNINVLGYHVRVQAFDGTGETLIELARFVPQPAEETVGTEETSGTSGGGALGLGILGL
ncbi:MAG: hypothetical protein EA377_12020 [Phycisphaerales bacterium]|nr:MAG: hypothetical protein EA377_12020 [Phycisphaerales bacterium]